MKDKARLYLFIFKTLSRLTIVVLLQTLDLYVSYTCTHFPCINFLYQIAK